MEMRFDGGRLVVRWAWNGYADAAQPADLETAFVLASQATKHPLRHDVLLR
ncbi:MAG: hypothetical protein QI223_02810 [Candidatus Korarchaeota archaeon]|nr:hypothetical protein [Candidatus Korarchaeota archaeon]